MPGRAGGRGAGGRLERDTPVLDEPDQQRVAGRGDPLRRPAAGLPAGRLLRAHPRPGARLPSGGLAVDLNGSPIQVLAADYNLNPMRTSFLQAYCAADVTLEWAESSGVIFVNDTWTHGEFRRERRRGRLRDRLAGRTHLHV